MMNAESIGLILLTLHIIIFLVYLIGFDIFDGDTTRTIQIVELLIILINILIELDITK